MNTIITGDIIEVTTPTRTFRAVVEHTSNNGLAGMMVSHAGGPHRLMSTALHDPAKQGVWTLDGEDGARRRCATLSRREARVRARDDEFWRRFLEMQERLKRLRLCSYNSTSLTLGVS